MEILWGVGDSFSVFEKVYAAYPRKEAKGLAKIAWTQLARTGALPELAVILAAISRFSASHNWQRENGRFIPQLSNFLKGERWNDPLSETEIEEKAAKEASEKARRQLKQEEEQRRAENEEKKALHKLDFDVFAAKFKGSFHFPMVFGIWMYYREKGVAPVASDVPEDNRLGIMDFIKSFANRAQQVAVSQVSQKEEPKQAVSTSVNTPPTKPNFFRQNKPDFIEPGFISAGKILKNSPFFMGLKTNRPKLRQAMAW